MKPFIIRLVTFVLAANTWPWCIHIKQRKEKTERQKHPQQTYGSNLCFGQQLQLKQISRILFHLRISQSLRAPVKASVRCLVKATGAMFPKNSKVFDKSMSSTYLVFTLLRSMNASSRSLSDVTVPSIVSTTISRIFYSY